MSYNVSNQDHLENSREGVGKASLKFRIPRNYCGSTTSTANEQLDDLTEIFDLDEFLPAFLAREHELWQATINTPVFQPMPLQPKTGTNSSEISRKSGSSSPLLSESIESCNTTTSTAGDQLLRHSQFLNEIHDYFVKLDYRRCCVTNESLFSNDEAPLNLTSGQMKVLNHGVSTTEKQVNTKRKKTFLRSRSKVEVPQLNLLNKKNKEIYKFALHCAHFPVLCCPQTPQPSPYVSNPNSSFHLSKSTSSPTAVSPTDSLAIEKTSLITLLRNAFELDVSVHEMYEKESLRRKGNPCNAAVELLRELHNNRVLLEENKHPVYKLSAFLFADGYEKWRTRELNSVKQLIKRICPTPISSLPVTNKLDSINCLEYYTVLESRLTKFEMAQRSTNVEEDENLLATDNPLSTASKRLLKEFAYRYGVGEVYRRVSSLSCLASNFTLSTWSIKIANHSVQSILKLLQTHYQVFLRIERDMLLEALRILLKQTKYVLENIGTLCPRFTSYEGVNALVNLLNSVVQVQTAFDEWDDSKPPIRDILSKCITDGAKESYKSLRTLALIDYEPMNYDGKLSPTVLRRILHDIRRKLRQFNQIEDNCICLKSYISLMKITAKELYCSFIRDVKEVIVNRTEETHTSSVDYELLGLAYRLARLDEEWKGFITIRDQRWRLYFILEARLITKAITEHILSLIKTFVSRDRETALKISKQHRTDFHGNDPPHRLKMPIKEQLFLGSNSLIQSSNSAFQSVSTVDKVDVSPMNQQPINDLPSLSNVSLSNPVKKPSMASKPIKVPISIVQPKTHSSSIESIHRPINPPPFSHCEVSSSSSQTSSIYSSGAFQSPRFSSPIIQSFATPKSHPSSLVIDSTQCSHISKVSTRNSKKYSSDLWINGCTNNIEKIPANELCRTVSLPNGYSMQSGSLDTDELWQRKSSRLSQFSQKDSFKSVDNQTENDYTSKDTTHSEHSHGFTCIQKETEVFHPSEISGTYSKTESSSLNSPLGSDTTQQFFSDEESQKSEEGPPKNGKLLITSSLMDTLLTLVHLIRFCGEISEVLSPEKQPSEINENNPLASEQTEAEEIAIAIRKDICRELTKSISTIVHAYADNVFALDLCGLSKTYFTQQLSKQISQHMIEMIKLGLLCGCRHLNSYSLRFDKNRNEFSFTACSWLKKRKSYAVLGWEKVTPQTCLRINNIYYMRKSLLTLQKICFQLCQVEMLPFAEDDDLFSDWSKETTKVQDESDWQLCSSLVTTAQYLTAVYHHQLMLVVARVMHLFESVLNELLKLNVKPNDDLPLKWKRHVTPLENIMKEHAHLFDNNLITPLRDQMKERLLLSVLEMVTLKINKLKENSIRSFDNAFCLWYAVELCCNTLNIDYRNDSEMAARINYIGLRLETYTMTTNDLGEMLHVIECALHDKTNFCKLSITEAICSIQESCKDRVSGKDLLAILQQDQNVLKAFSCNLNLDGFGFRERYKLLRIAQYLLEIKAFACVEIPVELQETREPGLVIVRTPNPHCCLSPSVSIDGSRISFDNLLSDVENDSDSDQDNPCESEDGIEDEDRDANFISNFNGNPYQKFLPLSSSFYSPLNAKSRSMKEDSLKIRLKEILCYDEFKDVCPTLMADCVTVLDSKWLIYRDVDALELLITVPGHKVQHRCSCPF